MAIVILSWGLAAILGFAAHRGSICTVRAVAEILSTGQAYYLLSFAKSVLWVLTVMFSVLLFSPGLTTSIKGYPLSTSALIGGLMFGMGAALNGGCSFSTLSRLADGQLRMLLTLGGFALGVALQIDIAGAVDLPRPVSSPALMSSLAPQAGAFAILLWLWAIYELRRLWSTRPPDAGLVQLLFARQYRVSTAAALMGSANGLLYLLHGPWAYTGALRQWVESLRHTGAAPTPMKVSLFAAAFAGMMLSSWQRGGFHLDTRIRPTAWAANLTAGLLMGTGAMLVPGGNDALILYGIPVFSCHALPAYGAMLLGIAVVITVTRRLTGRQMRVVCDGDLCGAETGPQDHL